MVSQPTAKDGNSAKLFLAKYEAYIGGWDK